MTPLAPAAQSRGGANGEGLLPSRRRKPKKAEEVAARVAAFRADEGDWPQRARFQQGVVPLNPGFAELERLRQATVEKAKKVKAVKKAKLRGER